MLRGAKNPLAKDGISRSVLYFKFVYPTLKYSVPNNCSQTMFYHMTSLIFRGVRRVTRVITLKHVHITPLTTSVSIMRFLIEIMFILRAKQSHKGSFDKQTFTLWVIPYEIYESK